MLRFLLVVAAALVALAVTSQGANAAVADRDCKTITTGGARVAVMVMRGEVSCRTARRVLRGYLASDAPCDGSGCVRMQYGWTCSTAPVLAFPRLASCARMRARVAAYSTAD
jgi:hypothetical protein